MSLCRTGPDLLVMELEDVMLTLTGSSTVLENKQKPTTFFLVAFNY